MEPSYKRPESVLVVVCASSGEVLMMRRRIPSDFWQSVTGSLLWGETKEEAARRELKEETGMDADENLVDCDVENTFSILPEWRSRYDPDVEFNTEHVFMLKLPVPCDIDLNVQEHLEYKWLPWQEAAKLASSYTNRDAILSLELPETI